MEWIGRLHELVMTKSLFAVAGAFGGGILAGFTPCTYPVIPIVVSFLGHQATKSGRRVFTLALTYVAGLSLFYGLLGTLALFSGKMFGFWAGNKWLYVLVGNICLIAGFVMLEWVKIPDSLTRSIYSGSYGTGVPGAFIMGATSALVVGPCTTPVLGAIFSIAATGDDVLQSLMLVLSFSFGIGFPILILGSFAGLVSLLPKSGPWLIKIQKVCGLLMILIGEYFLIKAGMF
ncbi:MAG: cytochrome c biogenesis protein CcdA [Thermodesulforhabdaceae bacterium]|jgi:thiol:disulfide interchange protein DsbD